MSSSARHRRWDKKAQDMPFDALIGLVAGAIIIFSLVGRASDFSLEAERTDEALANQLKINLETLASIPYPAQLTTEFPSIAMEVRPDGIYFDGERIYDSRPNLMKNTDIKVEKTPTEFMQFASFQNHLQIGGTLDALETVPPSITTPDKLKVQVVAEGEYKGVKQFLQSFNLVENSPDIIIEIEQGDQNNIACNKVTAICTALAKDLTGFTTSTLPYEETSRVAITIQQTALSAADIGLKLDEALRGYYV